MSNPDLEAMLAPMYEAADKLRKQNDNLLMAIGMIAATGNIQVMAGSMMFGSRPVIMLPPNMFERLCELFPAMPPAPAPQEGNAPDKA